MWRLPDTWVFYLQGSKLQLHLGPLSNLLPSCVHCWLLIPFWCHIEYFFFISPPIWSATKYHLPVFPLYYKNTQGHMKPAILLLPPHRAAWRKELSTLFYIYELTDTCDWLVLLWLGGGRVCHPSYPDFVPWLSVMDRCGIGRIEIHECFSVAPQFISNCSNSRRNSSAAGTMATSHIQGQESLWSFSPVSPWVSYHLSSFCQNRPVRGLEILTCP